MQVLKCKIHNGTEFGYYSDLGAEKKDLSNFLQWDMNKHRISFQPVCLQPVFKPLKVYIKT